MQSIKRDLFVGLSISTFLFIAALAWGSPFVFARAASVAQGQDQPQQSQPQPDQTQPQADQGQSVKTFTGTVQKSGSNFVLRDGAGQMFKLDDSARAKPYVGKAVKVKGQLDEQAMLIRVQSIESNEA